MTGGAALAGFHTKHRETRDLDLFFHHQQDLGSLVSDATQALQEAGLAVAPVRSSAMFAQHGHPALHQVRRLVVPTS